MREYRFIIEVFRRGETTSKVYNCESVFIESGTLIMTDKRDNERIEISFPIENETIDEIVIKPIKKEKKENDKNSI